MNVSQNPQKGGVAYQQDVLFEALKEIVPDYSYPNGFYAELQQFLFTNPHSFFDVSNLPPLLSAVTQQMSDEDQDNLLTVLEGAKGLILEYKLKDRVAYNQLVLTSKANRFFSKNGED